ncbi:MAG: glycosyltransferase family 39 protein [Candidatus Sericytochromatia bacterium]
MEPTRIPRHLPSEIALGLLLVLVLAPFVWTSHFPEDEFTTLSNGLRMWHGAVIYQDFFEFTAPLSHWLATFAFWLGGPSLVSARLAQAALLLLAGWQLHRLARALGTGPWVSLLPGLILVLALYRTLPGLNHHWVALPFALGALQAGMRGLDTGRARWWAAAGASGGMTTLAMQSDGPVTAVALAGAIALSAFMGENPRRALKQLLAAVAGMALPLGLAALYFASHGALGAAWHHVWEWPLAHYKTAGGANDVKFAMDLAVLTSTTAGWVNVPFWYAKSYHVVMLLALLPLTALGALAWGLGLAWRRVWPGTAWSPIEARYALVGLLVIGFGLLAVRGRADMAHVAEYAAPAVLLAVAVADQARRRLVAPELRLVKQLPLAMLVGFLLTGGLWLAQDMRQAPEAWLSLRSPDERLEDRPAIRYVREHAAPGDKIVAMPYPGPYYFYGRPPASRYTLILPPEAGYNTPAEFEAFWKEIERERPRYVIVSHWDGEAALGAYMRQPLPGYREVARKAIKAAPDAPRAVIFEREAP